MLPWKLLENDGHKIESIYGVQDGEIKLKERITFFMISE